MTTDAFGIPLLRGAAPVGRGINSAADIVTTTADGRDLGPIWRTYQDTLEAYNASRDPLVSLFTFGVTTLTEDVVQGGQILLERLSEFGIPQSRRVSLGYTTFGYDLNYYGTRLGYTRRFLASATADHLDTLHAAALEADNATVFRLTMQAIFSNVNRTAVIDGQSTIFPVYSLYNGSDGVTPPQYGANTFSSTHNHYVVSGGATLDSGDIEASIANVSEHGFSKANGSTLVVLANTAQVNVMRSWRANVANANGAVALFDFIPAQGQPGLIVGSNVLGVSQPASAFQGLPVAGSYGDALIVTSDFIPAGYVLTFATGGTNVTSNLVGLREHSNASERGFRLINGERVGYPLVDSFYERAIGTGIRQRGAAVVTQVKASGTYDVPVFAGGFE